MILHAGVNVRWAISRPKRELARMFRDESGKRLAAEEAKDRLLDELAAGREILPLGEACDGWDYKNGCPGHDWRPE